MKRAPNMSGPVQADPDEARLQRLDELIHEAREAERRESERKAEEERRRLAREAAHPGYTLDDLMRQRDALAAQIAARQHHLHTQSEREALQRRAEALSAEIQVEETKLSDKRAQRDDILRRL